MKIFTILATLWLMICFSTTLSAATSIPLRGIVEGFYGEPWSHAARLEMLRFCGEQGLNAYIYAPKDDPYHKARWRELYPEAEGKKLRELAETARQNNVELILALSPGADLAYTGEAATVDRQKMLTKLESLYQIGIRRFAFFFDDIKGMTEKSSVTAQDGDDQAHFINDLRREFLARHKDVGEFLTVPTEYFLEDMVTSDGVCKPYTEVFARELSPEVTVLYTGSGVVPEGIDAAEIKELNRIYGREVGVWWNYPVSDYMEDKLALGPVVNLPSTALFSAIFFNPMKHYELSKIALATGAEYAMNPSEYEPRLAWRKAIKEEYGKLFPDMSLFAEHSSRMENSWAHTGLRDGEILRQEMDGFWEAVKSSDSSLEERRQKLAAHFKTLIDAGENLQANLPPEILREARPQLNLFVALAKADLEALELFRPKAQKTTALKAKLMLKAKKFDDDKQARVSEKTLRAFLDEALKQAH